MPDGCILWTGTLDEDGYGRLFVRRRRWRAHRLAWTLERGPIPPGLVVMHRCDQPSCVRVDHLELGTQAENLRDRDRKRRTVVPVRRGGAWTGKVRRVRRAGSRT